MKRQERTLQAIMKEIDRIVSQHETEYDRAWLLAAIRSECSIRLASFDSVVRYKAELDATSPLRYIEKVRQEKRSG